MAWRHTTLAFCALAGALLAPAGAPGASLHTVVGTVVDAEDGSPLAGARVEVAGTDHAALSDEQGRFELGGLPPGMYHLRFTHPHHAEQSLKLAVPSAPLVIRLADAAFLLEALTVSGDPRDHAGLDDQRTIILDGVELQRRLDGSLAAALDGEAAVSRQAMGPAAERPVVRGLGGHRLPILADGAGPGDLSATAPDHALAIDPLLVESVELLRGPAALERTGGALAGVVNVRSGNLLQQRLDRATAQVAGQLGGAGSTRAGQVRAGAPLGLGFGLQADLALRRTDDLRTADGTLGNTAQQTWQGSAGLSLAGPQGYAGLAVSRLVNHYGIPGGFLGGHAQGVDIELERTRLESRAALHPGGGPLAQVEVQAAYARYEHRELESSGLCGVAFGQLTHEAALRGRLRRAGPLRDPVLGVSIARRDLAMACFSFLPPTVETSVGAFLRDDVRLGCGRLSAAVRWEGRAVVPAREDSNKAGRIRERTFSGLAAALAYEWPVAGPLALRAQVMRTWRPPAIEELFAEGPHLAAYAYEIGNADLGAERGTAVELTAVLRGRAGRLTATVFRNDVDGFIDLADTGLFEYGPGEEGFLARYQQRGLAAVLSGGEIAAAWLVGDSWELRFAGGWVRGTLRDLERPLPRIPPPQGRLELRREGGAWSTGLVLRGAAAQRRLGEFEEATAGYLAADAWVEWRLQGGQRLQTILLRLDNATDAAYRNHLSRLKTVMPEAGRSVSLGYRAYL